MIVKRKSIVFILVCQCNVLSRKKEIFAFKKKKKKTCTLWCRLKAFINKTEVFSFGFYGMLSLFESLITRLG
jgi:hypothetical protein